MTSNPQLNYVLKLKEALHLIIAWTSDERSRKTASAVLDDPTPDFSDFGRPIEVRPVETTEKPIGAQRYRMQASGYVVQQWADPKGDWVKSSDYEALRQRFERACHRVTELESSAVEPSALSLPSR